MTLKVYFLHTRQFNDPLVTAPWNTVRTWFLGYSFSFDLYVYTRYSNGVLTWLLNCALFFCQWHITFFGLDHKQYVNWCDIQVTHMQKIQFAGFFPFLVFFFHRLLNKRCLNNNHICSACFFNVFQSYHSNLFLYRTISHIIFLNNNKR